MRTRLLIPAVALICGTIGFCQSPAPVLEVASMKRVVAAADGRLRFSMRGGPGSSDPSQINYTNASLMTLLRAAYDAQPFQLEGPSWLSSELYDIQAKLPPGSTKEQFRQMLASLLAERLHLVIHREFRQLSGYELVIAKSGSKLRESVQTLNRDAQPPSNAPTAPPRTDENGFPILDKPGVAMTMKMAPNAKMPSIYFAAKTQSLDGLVKMIGEELKRPVLDATGLTSKYDFNLEFAPDSGGGRPPQPTPEPGLADAPDATGPNIMSAVQNQLGLHLVAKKVPFEIIVIDSVQKEPSEN